MDKLYEWWQLFDPKTRRYYYYNIKSDKTAWHLPLSSSDETTTSSSLCDTNTSTIKAHPLASRLVSLLIKNHSLLNNTSTNDLNILYDNLRRDGGNVSSSLLEADMMSDEKFLRLFLNKNLSMIERTLNDDDDDDNGDKQVTHTKCLIKTKATSSVMTSSSIVSVPLNAAMSSLTNLSPNTNITTATTTQRRLLPRTNPNYVNVDLIDSNNGKTTIKNTYVRLQDLNGRNEKENNDDHKVMTFNSLRRPPSTNLNKEERECTNETTSDLYQQATTLLLSILKNTEKGECDMNFF